MGWSKRPKFLFTLILLKGRYMGVAKRYKCFSNLTLINGPRMGGPSFDLPLLNIKAHTWMLQKSTSAFQT